LNIHPRHPPFVAKIAQLGDVLDFKTLDCVLIILEDRDPRERGVGRDCQGSGPRSDLGVVFLKEGVFLSLGRFTFRLRRSGFVLAEDSHLQRRCAVDVDIALRERDHEMVLAE